MRKLRASTFISIGATIGLFAIVTPSMRGQSPAPDIAAERESQVCGPQTLNGTYVFDAHGFNIINGASVPKAILDVFEFHGDGTFVSPFVSVSVNGTIIHAMGTTGTYSLKPDCTGTISTNDGASYDAYVRKNGKEIYMNQTIAPGGTKAVMAGTADRISR